MEKYVNRRTKSAECIVKDHYDNQQDEEAEANNIWNPDVAEIPDLGFMNEVCEVLQPPDGYSTHEGDSDKIWGNGYNVQQCGRSSLPEYMPIS